MPTMKNHWGSFLSRLVLPGLVALLVLLSPALVKADVVRTFVVSGTAINSSGMKLDSCAADTTCAFSGMFQVDTTGGTVEGSGYNITFPGLRTFGLPVATSIIGTQFRITFVNTNDAVLVLFLTTAPTPLSFVGFTGGSITGDDVISTKPPAEVFYSHIGGSITPAPEPSSLVLFASGMLVLGLARRFGKKVVHPLSA